MMRRHVLVGSGVAMLLALGLSGAAAPAFADASEASAVTSLAPQRGVPPCSESSQSCGLGGHNVKQSLQVIEDEYWACNPGGQTSSARNEDDCLNNFEHNEDTPGSAQPNVAADRARSGAAYSDEGH